MLRIQNISFAYDTEPVLQDITFTVKKGQHLALIGESGCGKSTLLKIIYGLLQADQGSLFWQNRKLLGPLYHLVPGEENMKYLSQGFELQSYRTVAENIGEYLSNFEPELKRGRVNELLEIVEMTAFGNTKVERLSGGQKQRVALARALAKRPEVLLLDEPFGNIDNFRRSSLRRNLFNYLSRNKITSITATHDKTDILSFAEETIVLHKGRLLVKEKTEQLYKNPGSYTVASLFGEVNSFRLSTLNLGYQKAEVILIYPHEIIIDPDSSLEAVVKKSYFNGSFYLIEAIFDQRIIFVESSTPFAEKESLGFLIPKELIETRII